LSKEYLDRNNSIFATNSPNAHLQAASAKHRFPKHDVFEVKRYRFCDSATEVEESITNKNILQPISHNYLCSYFAGLFDIKEYKRCGNTSILRGFGYKITNLMRLRFIILISSSKESRLFKKRTKSINRSPCHAMYGTIG
jgi:hypothetical protein